MAETTTKTAAHHRHNWHGRFIALASVLIAGGVLVDAAAQVRGQAFLPSRAVEAAKVVMPPMQPLETVVWWEGRDIDGDGAPDFVNPTGNATRTEDAYGYGHFGASRDGGSRDHEGVDYIAEAGQKVVAPISGYVTKIGYAYAGDENLKFVEISNPALRYQARVFYVNPTVEVGQSLRLGQQIGKMHSLQDKYPRGMTDHVHVELMAPSGRRVDATRMIVERVSERARG